METIYRPELQRLVTTIPATRTPVQPPVTRDWRQQLPILVGEQITLRELKLSDAPALLATMTSEDVARFISTPPETVDGFERFITWTQCERAEGRYACFAIVPHGATKAVGLFQLRQLDRNFTTAEWGFAIASEYWGTGCFMDGARLVVDFAVDTVGVHRLEARSAVRNGRGNGALRKLGAVHEGVLRCGFRKDGEQMDQSIWSILADEWRHAKAIWTPAILH